MCVCACVCVVVNIGVCVYLFGLLGAVWGMCEYVRVCALVLVWVWM